MKTQLFNLLQSEDLNTTALKQEFKKTTIVYSSEKLDINIVKIGSTAIVFHIRIGNFQYENTQLFKDAGKYIFDLIENVPDFKQDTKTIKNALSNNELYRRDIILTIEKLYGGISNDSEIDILYHNDSINIVSHYHSLDITIKLDDDKNVTVIDEDETEAIEFSVFNKDKFIMIGKILEISFSNAKLISEYFNLIETREQILKSAETILTDDITLDKNITDEIHSFYLRQKNLVQLLTTPRGTIITLHRESTVSFIITASKDSKILYSFKDKQKNYSLEQIIDMMNKVYNLI